MRWKNASLEELDLSLATVVPPEVVTVEGQWVSSRRRTYQSKESRPGVGPFVDVVDRTWSGSLTCPSPLAAIVLLAGPTDVYWAKSAQVAARLPVLLSLHAYADGSSDLATFAGSVGDASPPAIPVPCARSIESACAIGAGRIVTGRLSVLASVEGAELLVLLVQAERVRVGRNRLWRLRDEHAADLPLHLRELLTRRRSGSLSVPGRHHRLG